MNYQNKTEVEYTLDGNWDNTHRGLIVGISFLEIITLYIVMVNKEEIDSKYDCITLPESYVRGV